MADHLRRQIARGQYLPGSIFPTRDSLAIRHRLAPMTVQRSVNILQREGWLISGNGVPTRVADPLPLVPVHTQVIEGTAELDLQDDDTVAIVEVVVDDDAPSSTYARLHSWSSMGEHPDLERLAGQRVRVTVEVLQPLDVTDDAPDAMVLTLPGMIDS